MSACMQFARKGTKTFSYSSVLFEKLDIFCLYNAKKVKFLHRKELNKVIRAIFLFFSYI